MKPQLSTTIFLPEVHHIKEIQIVTTPIRTFVKIRFR